jgi:hypothetical protein
MFWLFDILLVTFIFFGGRSSAYAQGIEGHDPQTGFRKIIEERLREQIRAVRDHQKLRDFKFSLKESEEINPYLFIENELIENGQSEEKMESISEPSALADASSDELPTTCPSLLEFRYGDLNHTEYLDLSKIIHGKLVEQEHFVTHRLDGHGVAENKGGIKNLINIMLEGMLYTQFAGPLTLGNPSMNAGHHGPFFVILDTKLFQQEREKKREVFLSGFKEKFHMAYLVPSERHKEKIFLFLEIAEKKLWISKEEKNFLKNKVITYQRLIQISKEDPMSVMSSKALGKKLLSNRKFE